MATAIKVENLSKIYRLGEIGTGTISRDIERFVKTKILKQEDPFLKIGETNDRATKGSSDIVYSLKDINFEIEQGDAVGIIGRNGAGKSTLLKILSRVTSPTTGKINIKGRVASLLEVGTGFHPELTGRENIYLNGAILGMRKREIDHKLEEIIDFSGVERYIDTPVKRYSSGMYVRLAFAVAAHLESEILIVDEVLAVGDAEFQKKCLGKMGEISKGGGRTVLFVSHNMAAILKLCENVIYLKNGIVESIDNSYKLAEQYYNINDGTIYLPSIENYSNKGSKLDICKIELINNRGGKCIYMNESIVLNLVIDVKIELLNMVFGFSVKDKNGNEIFFCYDYENQEIANQIKLGINKISIEISNCLNEGLYLLDFMCFENINYQERDSYHLSNVLSFEVIRKNVNIIVDRINKTLINTRSCWKIE